MDIVVLSTFNSHWLHRNLFMLQISVSQATFLRCPECDLHKVLDYRCETFGNVAPNFKYQRAGILRKPIKVKVII